MVIVTRKHLSEAAIQHRDAADAIAALTEIASNARWTSFVDLKATIVDADMVDGYVIFNIRGNRYRLVTVVHFAKEETKGHVYIRSFLTHKEYNNRANWDRTYGK